MHESNFKNMIVLKNLPSNIVDEAIVVLKQNTKIKKLEKIENNKKNNNQNPTSKKTEYIVREAKMIVEEYLNQIEKNQKKIELKKKSRDNYKLLKRYAWFATFVIIVQAFIIVL